MENEQETRSEKVPPAKKQVWVRKEKKFNDHLLDLENSSLHELISILEKFASDPQSYIMTLFIISQHIPYPGATCGH